MIKGITASAFDLLHVGHIEMIREAKEQCDYLICCLHVNPSMENPQKTKPAQSLVERYIQLQAVKYVDEIIPYETESDLVDILEIKTPYVRVIGEEYADKAFTGKTLCKNTHYNKRKHRFSSTELRGRLKKEM